MNVINKLTATHSFLSIYLSLQLYYIPYSTKKQSGVEITFWRVMIEFYFFSGYLRRGSEMKKNDFGDAKARSNKGIQCFLNYLVCTSLGGQHDYRDTGREKQETWRQEKKRRKKGHTGSLNNTTCVPVYIFFSTAVHSNFNQ